MPETYPTSVRLLPKTRLWLCRSAAKTGLRESRILQTAITAFHKANPTPVHVMASVMADRKNGKNGNS